MKINSIICVIFVFLFSYSQAFAVTRSNVGGVGGTTIESVDDLPGDEIDDELIDAPLIKQGPDSGLNADKVDGKDAADLVDKTSNETIGGTKTFTVIPILPASDPTSENQAVRKAYTDATFETIANVAAMYGELISAVKAGDSYLLMIDTGTGGVFQVWTDSTLVASFSVSGNDLGPNAADEPTVDDKASPVTAKIGTAGSTITMWTLVKKHSDGKYDPVVAGEIAEGISVGALTDNGDGSQATDGEKFLIMTEGFGYDTSWGSLVFDHQLCTAESGATFVDCTDSSICNALNDVRQWIGTVSGTNLVEFNFKRGYITCNGN